MEITSDIILRGESWNKVVEAYSPFFEKPNLDIFILALSIGILRDKKIDEFNSQSDFQTLYVPRNVIANWAHGKLDIMFQVAILTSKTIELSEDDRLEIAFGEKKFEKIKFLTGFANYGVTELVKIIPDSATEVENMDALNDFLKECVESNHLEDIFSVEELESMAFNYDEK